MSGEKESKTAKDELAKWDAILDEYEGSLSLPNIKTPGTKEELEGYLSMDRSALEKLSDKDAAYIAFRLCQYAAFIQKAQNRETARVNWAKATLKDTIATAVNSFKGYSYEERAAQAIRDNSRATSLNNIAIYAQQRSDRLSFISRSLTNLAEFLKQIVYVNKVKNDDARNTSKTE